MAKSTDESCSRRLLAAFTDHGVLSATARRMLEQFMAVWRIDAADALLATQLLSEEALADALAKAFDLPRLADFADVRLHLGALPVVTFARARAWECLPLENADGSLTMVFVDPSRSDCIDVIKQSLGVEFTLAVGALNATLKAIDELYPLAAQLPSLYGR